MWRGRKCTLFGSFTSYQLDEVAVSSGGCILNECCSAPSLHWQLHVAKAKQWRHTKHRPLHHIHSSLSHHNSGIFCSSEREREREKGVHTCYVLVARWCKVVSLDGRCCGCSLLRVFSSPLLTEIAVSMCRRSSNTCLGINRCTRSDDTSTGLRPRNMIHSSVCVSHEPQRRSCIPINQKCCFQLNFHSSSHTPRKACSKPSVVPFGGDPPFVTPFLLCL